MSSGPTYKVPFKRKKNQKTNYKKRLAILKSNKPRFVVRLSNSLVRCQLINYKIDGDVVVDSAISKDLVDLGWKGNLKNTPAVYLTALLLAQKIKKKNIKEVVFDLGSKNYKSKSKIFAALKAIIDSDIKCAYDKKAFPEDNRINGKVIDDYLKNNISKQFEDVKNKILKM
jgi:large subunit ribosomal protein L18